MRITELACGDVVTIKGKGIFYAAMIINLGAKPLVVKIEDLEMDKYEPFTVPYDDIIVVSHHTDIKKALLKVCKQDIA